MDLGLEADAKKEEVDCMVITEMRTKQLRQCKRMMKNNKKTNRYCNCCSPDSASPSPENPRPLSGATTQYLKPYAISDRDHLILHQQAGKTKNSTLADKNGDKTHMIIYSQNKQKSQKLKDDTANRLDSARTKKLKAQIKEGVLMRIAQTERYEQIFGVKFKEPKQTLLQIDSMNF